MTTCETGRAAGASGAAGDAHLVLAWDNILCGRCQLLKGGGQTCACTPRRPAPGGERAAIELCRCCGAQALRGGLKWSVWFCQPCKWRVRAVNDRFGRCIIPIGRHSLMNGVWSRVITDADALAFADQLRAFFRQAGETEKVLRRAVLANRELVGLPREADVSAWRYLVLLREFPDLKQQRFDEMVGLLDLDPFDFSHFVEEPTQEKGTA